MSAADAQQGHKKAKKTKAGAHASPCSAYLHHEFPLYRSLVAILIVLPLTFVAFVVNLGVAPIVARIVYLLSHLSLLCRCNFSPF
jgi:hypothetical protein